MGQPLSAARCFHHATREAIGRCKGCRRHYCRECLAEVQGKMVCAQCMTSDAPEKPKRLSFGKILAGGTVLLGILALWLLFFSLGRLLLTLPEAFHSGFFE